MRELSKLEYDLCRAIIEKDYRDCLFFDQLEKASGISWGESKISLANQDMLEDMYTLLGIPEDTTEDPEKTPYYCRDWVGELYFNHLRKNNFITEVKAKNFLDELLSRLNICVKIS